MSSTINSFDKNEIIMDRYEILAEIGSGGFATTYKAMDHSLDIPVAIKAFHKHTGASMDEAVKEAKIAAGLYELEGIASARDFFWYKETPCIIMDYVDGTSIKDYVREHGRIRGDKMLILIKPLLQSLIKIHEKGILHRDISADNILLTEDGRLKLIDFGAARLSQNAQGDEYTIIFKRGFAPIEQCSAGGKQGPWTDVYGICATMYYMITGIVPDDSVSRLIEDKQLPLERIDGVRLTPQAMSCIMKGLAVRPEKRFQSMSEFYTALYAAKPSTLANILNNTTIQGGKVENGEANFTEKLLEDMELSISHKKSRRKKQIIIGAVVAVLLILSGSIWGILQHRSTVKDQIPHAPASSITPAINSTSAEPDADLHSSDNPADADADSTDTPANAPDDPDSSNTPANQPGNSSSGNNSGNSAKKPAIPALAKTPAAPLPRRLPLRKSQTPPRRKRQNRLPRKTTLTAIWMVFRKDFPMKHYVINSSEDILTQLHNQHYQRTDLFLIRKWRPAHVTGSKQHTITDPDNVSERSGQNPADTATTDISDELRQEAYLNFYRQVKPFKLASRQTIQRWFGIGGYAVPHRRQILELALNLHFSLDETEDYLLHGLSQWNLQVNDYEEMLCMYCLENGQDPETYRFMVDFFETHTDQELRPLQTARTDLLQKSYATKKSLSVREFLVWMCHNAELFKGYSMTVYSYYVSLLNEAFQYYQKQTEQDLMLLLERSSYSRWKQTEQETNPLFANETEKDHIRRYLKNVPRRKNNDIAPDDLRTAQNYYAIAYAPKARISSLLAQLYHNGKSHEPTRNNEMYAELQDFLGEEIQWENEKYISELLSMSIQKEQQMLYQRAFASLQPLDSTDRCPDWITRHLQSRYPQLSADLTVKHATKIISAELKKQKTRVRNIQRSDLLLLIQYTFSVKYDQKLQETLAPYNREDATKGFLTLANTILTSCNMRKVNAQYRLDQLLLSCITDEEIILLGDLLDKTFFWTD